MTIDAPKVFVTGGTGLVGRSVVRRLIANETAVRVMSRSGQRVAHPMVTMLRGDVTSIKDLRAAMWGCHAVVHCAGEKNDLVKMRSVNINGTKLVFELAAECGVEFFCHLSSVGVVGPTRLKVVDESADCNPGNMYEETKLAAEEIVGRGLPGGRVVILRPTNIFGPEALGEWSNRRLGSKGRLLVTGREKAHLVYVEDVGAAAVHCLQSNTLAQVDTFIVSSDEEPGNTRREVQASLAATIASAPKPFRWSAPLFVPYWLRRIRRGQSNFGDVVYSSRKLRQAGFQFPYGLANGLNDAIRRWQCAPDVR